VRIVEVGGGPKPKKMKRAKDPGVAKGLAGG